MKLYFLTDESEKSLAPFFSRHVLDAVMAGVAHPSSVDATSNVMIIAALNVAGSA